MSVIVELSVPVEDFPLGRALATTPDMQVELDRIVPTDTGALPFFWISGDDVEAFVAELEREEDVDAVSVLDRFEDGALIRATWTATTGLVEGILQSEATVLEVARYDDVWRLRLRSPDREAVAALQRYCADNDIDLRLDRINDLSGVETGQRYGLTDDQRRTIVTAFDEGYFDDPRGTTLEELGTEFDISSRAVSKRLRRGLRNLVDATLIRDEL